MGSDTASTDSERSPTAATYQRLDPTGILGPMTDVPTAIPADIKRLVPGATVQLPARQLSTAGGGRVATDPTDGQGLTALQKMFQIDLEIPSGSNPIKLGGRAYVRFNHGWAPLAVQWYFQIRQIFLSRFDV